MCSPSKCIHITKMICRQIQEHYICTRLDQYIKILNNPSYIEEIGMSQREANLQIQSLWSKRRELQSFTVIRQGKVKKRISNYFPDLISDEHL